MNNIIILEKQYNNVYPNSIQDILYNLEMQDLLEKSKANQ
jgi:hypothetical protein